MDSMDSMDFGTAGLGFFKLHRRFRLIAFRILDLDSFSSDGIVCFKYLRPQLGRSIKH